MGMATGWVKLKSLQCKSTAIVDDVYHPSPNHKSPLPSSFSTCKNTLHDVIPHPKPKRKPKPDSIIPNSIKPQHPRRSTSLKPKPKPNPTTTPPPPNPRVRRTLSEPVFPTVSELQPGHPSRNVVEIIFQTRWDGPRPFPGQIQTVLKIQTTPRTLSHFEQYRDSVRSRATAQGGRCSVDGNEMMRFRCLGPTSSASPLLIDADFKAVCTFSASASAHHCAGGGKGRRAMLLCRVIAGRVSNRVGLGLGLVDGPGELEFDSMSGENGELLVFDSRAVLPCFLVIYKL